MHAWQYSHLNPAYYELVIMHEHKVQLHASQVEVSINVKIHM